MERVEKMTKTGSSKSRLTSGNVIGALAGSKTSQNRVKRTVLANNKRQYTRKTTVWMCKECSGTNDRIRAEEDRADKEIEREKEQEARLAKKQSMYLDKREKKAAAAKEKAELNALINQKAKDAKALKLQKAKDNDAVKVRKAKDARALKLQKTSDPWAANPKSLGNRLRGAMKSLKDPKNWTPDLTGVDRRQKQVTPRSTPQAKPKQKTGSISTSFGKAEAKRLKKANDDMKAMGKALSTRQKVARKNTSKRKPVSKPDTYASRVQQAAAKNKSKRSMDTFASHVKAAAAKNKRK